MTNGSNSSDDNVFNETYQFYDPVIDQIAEFIWWYVIVTAVIGTFLNIFGLIYLLTKRRAGTVVTCMSCVVVADCAFLISVLGGLLLARMFPDIPGSVICKLMTFNTNVTSLFSNWCWVILWGGHYLAVFHPWRYYRMKYYSKLNCVLPSLLLACVIWECWTLLFTTDVNSTCDLDTNIATYVTFKYLLLLESCITFFLPLILVLIADVKVFFWKSPIELLGSSELCNEKRIVKMEQVAIVSLKFKKILIDGNRKIMRRFVALASLDLLLNFPQVILHLIVAFRRGSAQFSDNNDTTDKNSVDYGERLEYIISALGYSFYYLQYLMNAVHIAMLIPAEEQTTAKLHNSHQNLNCSSGACSPNVRMFGKNNSFSRNSNYSKNYDSTEKLQNIQKNHEKNILRQKRHLLTADRPRAASSPLFRGEKVDFV